ncbi:MAG: hypothetical protein KGN32_07350 [Burkholderiales bacterium]|nr:hypothetical protein [Burkholderiales bacterium]
MHLVIDHAAPSGPHCQAATAKLQLPHLAAWLGRLAPAQKRAGGPQDLTPLSEHLRAAARGIDAEDGLLPWAAADAHRLGLKEASQLGGWAWITPCHWRVNAYHVEMLDPADLALTDEETATLMDAMRGYFAGDGITLQALTTGTWLAHGAVFKELATASLERARDARIDTWMPRQPQAKTLRRLQNEMQMLLYTHPVNDARAAQRQTTVNSFWVSGTGELPANYPGAAEPETLTVDASLRAAALRDDAAAWLEAWSRLDSSALAKADAGSLTLTLCGEHQAITFAPVKGSWLTRLRKRLNAPTPVQLLSTL